jgi:hypothetical protein
MALWRWPEHATKLESPAGVNALAAVKSNDQMLLRSILGPRSRKLVSSGDEIADAKDREAFLKAYDEPTRSS